MRYILEKTALGFCWLDIPAALILIGVCVYSYVKLKKMKEQEQMLVDRVAGMAADDALKTEYEAKT